MTTLAQQNIQRNSNDDTIGAKLYRATFQGDDTESSEIMTTNKHNSYQHQGNGTESTVQPAKLQQNKRHKT
ncbi:9407_t:CDS:1, partial [Gigaspora margarita]